MSETSHRRSKIAPLAAGLLLVLGLACSREREQPAKAEAVEEAPTATSRIEELSRISARKDVDAVSAEDVGHREAAIRRGAARSLARMVDARALPKLLSLLSDEDPETIAFAAQGLGALAEVEGAEAKAKEIVGALVARSLSLPPKGSSRFDPAEALVRALGRFDLERVEPTLAAWLDLPAPWGAASALALGEVASRKKALAAATQEALLGAAEASGLSEPLFPFGRLDRVESSLGDRLLEAARARLGARGEGRLFAIRALGRAGSAALPDLERVLLSAGDFDGAERAEAARALARLGAEGELALGKALATFVKADDPSAFLEGAAYGPWLTVVEMLRGSAPLSREQLRALVAMTPKDDLSKARERRFTQLQCAALPKLAAAGLPDELIKRCHRAAPAEKGEMAALDVTAEPLNQATKLTFVTDAGPASLVIDPIHAPAAAARIVALARMGHYDGARIPLVVQGSFIRMEAGPDRARPSALPSETVPVSFGPFTVGVALDEGAETGSDKLFVTLGRHPELDGRYALLGQADEAFAKLAEGDIIERVIIEAP